jgi:hypothetical protein
MEGRWCAECFEDGLHKDMNDHFENFVKQEIKEMNDTDKPRIWSSHDIADAYDNRGELGETEFIEHSVYEKLRAERDELKVENERLKAKLE